MKELKFFNIGYNENILNNEIDTYLNSSSSNLVKFSNNNDLLDLITTKNINLLIIKYNFEALKKIRAINSKVQIVAILDELKKEYLYQSLELEHIKFLKNIDSKNVLKNVLKECINHYDSKKSNIINLKNSFIYDSYNQTLFRENKLISLSNKESQLLELLIKNQNRDLTYKEIEDNIWDGKMSQDALRSVIKELRKKVYKELIKNVSGVGYRLDLI